MAAVDPATSQNLYDALKGFISPDAATPHTWLYNAVKDFQPFIAASIAITVAWIAYKGAMAPVKLNRELAKRQRATDRQPLYYRVRAELNRLVMVSERTVQQMDEKVPQRPEFDADVPWDGVGWLIYSDYGEIEKAWDSLQLMPRDAIPPLTRVRASLAVAKRFTDEYEAKSTVKGHMFLSIRGSFCTIAEQGKIVIDEIEAALKEFPTED